MIQAETIEALAQRLPGVEFLTEQRQVERLSRDFAWFSPVLKERLADKRADAIARPADEDSLKALVGACAEADIPMTLRGAGTGNYGQATPLNGGLVVDMSRLNAVRWVEGGVARVQSGIRLVEIDKAAQPQGWEMRLAPSTYRLATAGGFYCGGFGGVGSITWGSLGDPGNVLAVRALSVEKEPRIMEFRDQEARDLYHAYGVNGIITEIEFALAPAYDWTEALVSFPDFMQAMHFAQSLGNASGVVKKLLTVLADPIPQMAGLERHVAAGRHAVLTVIATPGMDHLRASAAEHGGRVDLEQDGNAMHGSPSSLIEHTWNHTTLHTLKKHKDITYLQCGFRPHENLKKVEHMYRHFGDEAMMHLEFLRADGAVTCSGLQLVRYTSEARLNEIIEYLRDNGVHVANPHTYILEDGGKLEVDPGQLAMKHRLDPRGLLNPGKMRAWDSAA